MADGKNDMLDKIKDRLDIVELIGEYVHLKKSGSNHIGLCPFHSEKTPSFTVSDSKQMFHCFGCGAGGDAITFVMRRENLDFVEALKFLAEKYNIPWEDSGNQENSELRQVFYEINKEAARYFHQNLMKHKEATAYLNSRGIGYETARKFGLGFASDSWEQLMNFLRGKGFSEADIEKTGLIGIRKNVTGFYDKFRNRLIFPIVDTRSRVIGFGGRVLDKSLPKYLNSPDTVVFNKGNHLYGLNIVDKNKNRSRIMLVEGYMDVISLHSNGIDYAVASLGTALTETQAKLLKRYGDEIYICYDGDQAGIRATVRAIDVMQRLDLEPRIVMLPEGMDPDDFIKNNSLAAFEKKVAESLNHIDFKVYILKGKHDLKSPEGKIRFTQEAARMLKELKSPIQQDVYIEKLSSELAIAKEAIASEMKGPRHIREHKSTEIRPVSSVVLEPARRKAEADLISLMASGRNNYTRITADISMDEFGDPDCRFCYKLIQEGYSADDELNKEVLLKELDFDDTGSERLKQLLTRTTEYTPSNLDKVIVDLIKTIRLDRLEAERKELKQEIETLDSSATDGERLSELLRILIEIDKKINLIS